MRAVDEIRTRDIHLGKVVLYQLSYNRISTIYPVGVSASVVRVAAVKTLPEPFPKHQIELSAASPTNPAPVRIPRIGAGNDRSTRITTMSFRADLALLRGHISENVF